jgi:hypothetical protein
MTDVQSPAEAEDFSYSLCVQTDSDAHLASCPVGTWDLFPRYPLDRRLGGYLGSFPRG